MAMTFSFRCCCRARRAGCGSRRFLTGGDRVEWSRRTLFGDVDGDGFFRTTGEDGAVGEDRGGPAFSVEDIGAGDFRVFVWGGGDEDEFTGIAEGEQGVAAGEDQISWAEAVLAPFDFTGGHFEAGDGAFAIFFEAEHAVEVTVFDDWRAPMVGDLITFFAPEFFCLEAAAFFEDFGAAHTDAITGGAVDHVLVDDGGGGGADAVGEIVAPEDFSIFRADGDEAVLGKEDDLADAVDGGGDGGGVGHFVIFGLPGDLT